MTVRVNAAEFQAVVVGEIAAMLAVEFVAVALEFEPDEDPPPPQALAKTQPAAAIIERIAVQPYNWHMAASESGSNELSGSPTR